MPDTKPSLPTLVDKTLTRVQSRGPGEVIKLGLHRVREAIASVDELILYSGTAAEVPSRPVPTDLEVRVATEDDAEAYAGDIGTDSPRSFRARLSDSTRCFIVFSQGRLIHSTWVTTAAAWTRELKRYLRPPAGDAYIYESFTRAEVRGRGTYPIALGYISATMSAEGIAKLWVGVEADNTSSIRSIEKAGFRPAFRVPHGRRLGGVWVGPADGPQAEVARVFIRSSP